jgi:hypothetical protein
MKVVQLKPRSPAQFMNESERRLENDAVQLN